MSDYSIKMEELLEDLEGNDWVADPDAPLRLEDEEGNVIPMPGDNEQPSEDELDDAVFEAHGRETELVNIMEMLQSSGGVSRDMANQFRDLLPPEMAMESFTVQVTQTNHVMAMEYVGTAIKIAAAAGVVAVLGAVGYLIYRITKSRKRMPKNKLDKAVSAAYGTAEEKLKVVLEGLKHEFPDIEHVELKWNKEEALVQMAIQCQMQELDLRMMTGTYKSFVGMAGPDALVQANEIKKFFDSAVFPELDKMLKAGTGKDVDDITKKIQEFKFTDTVSKHLDRFGHDMQVNFERPDQVCEKFRAKYSRGVSAEDAASKLKGVKPNGVDVPEQAAVGMYKAQDIMTQMLVKVKNYEKKLEKTKELPADYVAQIKGVLEKCKPPLKSLGDVFNILEMEIASQTRCAKIKGLAVAEGYKNVANHYKERAITDKEHRASYRACVKVLDKSFDDIRGAMKL